MGCVSETILEDWNMTKFGAKTSILLGTLGLVSLVSLGSPTTYAQDTMFTDGTQCEITRGLNQGKRGVFTDGGNWCTGDWGASECRNSDMCRAI
jgi:hypothetical protein